MASSRSISRKLVCGAVLLLLTAPLIAQTFALGDLIVTGSGPGTSPPTFTNWKILWFDANGTLKGTLYDQPQSPSAGSEAAFGPGSALYAIVSGQILRVAPNGTTSALPTTGFTPRFLTVAADGRLYFSNLVGNHIVGALSSTLQPAGSFDIGDDALSVDLAVDQCTLYYHSGAPAQISRFNVCTGAPLTPFSAPKSGVTYGMLRILPDGVLQSHAGPGGVVRRNAAGQVVQSYPSWGFALALDLDRQSFWSVQGTSLFKVDLATGNVVRGPLAMLPHLTSVFSIAVVGEPRAAVAAANVADIPALSPWLLILLVSAMGVVSLLRLR